MVAPLTMGCTAGPSPRSLVLLVVLFLLGCTVCWGHCDAQLTKLVRVVRQCDTFLSAALSTVLPRPPE